MATLYINLTPITDNNLMEVGFDKVYDKKDVTDYYWSARIPKFSADPNASSLVSSFKGDYKEFGLKEGEFVVEIFDTGGLGECRTMEELELLYFALTKQSLYEN